MVSHRYDIIPVETQTIGMVINEIAKVRGEVLILILVVVRAATSARNMLPCIATLCCTSRHARAFAHIRTRVPSVVLFGSVASYLIMLTCAHSDDSSQRRRP